MTRTLLLHALAAFSCAAPLSHTLAEVGNVVGTDRMHQARSVHTASLLPDGGVLVVGGMAGEADTLASAEVFVPGVGFREVSPLATRRAGHTATTLPNGRILIAGGLDRGTYLDSTEIYDPETRRFIAGDDLVTARSGHIAVPLADGRVLLAGGVGDGWTFLASAELYDPITGAFTATGDMAVTRESHVGARLHDGRVLVVGGHSGRRPATVVHASTELYDPIRGSFAPAASMHHPRHKHAAALLPDRRVLVVGGSDERDGAGAYAHAELYDGERDVFSPAPDMHRTRYKIADAVAVLADGGVLIAGGGDQAERYDPRSDRFELVPGGLADPRRFAVATRLADGTVLITGGYDDRGQNSATAWLYRP